MSKVFDAERFRMYAEQCFGLNYLKRLSEITGRQHKTVYKWCSPDYAPKKGLDSECENAISKALFKQGISINWTDFYKNVDNGDDNEVSQVLDEKISTLNEFDPYDALIQAKKDIILLSNTIHELQNELYLKENENLLLRKEIAKMTNL